MIANISRIQNILSSEFCSKIANISRTKYSKYSKYIQDRKKPSMTFHVRMTFHARILIVEVKFNSLLSGV